MQELTVSCLCSVTPPNVVREGDSVRRAALCLLQDGTDEVCVTDAEGHFRGVVTEACIMRVLLSDAADETDVAAVISRHVETARPSAALQAVIPLFRSSCRTRLPVVSADGVLFGVLPRSAVLRHLMQTDFTADENNADAAPSNPQADPGHAVKGPRYLRAGRARYQNPGHRGASSDASIEAD